MKKALLILVLTLSTPLISKAQDKKNTISYFIDGDTIQYTTPYGHLSQFILISDSTYIWTYSNRNHTVVLDTLSDGQLSHFKIHWETKGWLGLISGCGTHCWTNKVIKMKPHFRTNTYSYSAVDTICLNIIEIKPKYLKLTHLVSQDTLLIPHHFDQFRSEGYPLFYMNITELSCDSLEYKIELPEKQHLIRKIGIPSF